MKAVKKNFVPVKSLVIFLLTFLLFTSATAQNVQYRDPAYPERGYWQIVTNATTKNTVIYFFDGQKNKLYEETIPGKYIKLTDRNIAKINKTFDQIAGKTMVLAQVKAEPLTSPAFRRIINRKSKKEGRIKKTNQVSEESVTSSLDSDSELKVHAYQIHHTAKVYLTLRNPNQERLNIYILNKVGENIYHNNINKPYYTFQLNFEKLDYGKYKIIVTTANRKQKYTKLLDINPPAQLLHEKQSKPILELNSELANR